MRSDQQFLKFIEYHYNRYALVNYFINLQLVSSSSVSCGPAPKRRSQKRRESLSFPFFSCAICRAIGIDFWSCMVCMILRQDLAAIWQGGPLKLHNLVFTLCYIFYTRCHRWYSEQNGISYEFNNDSFSFSRSNDYIWSVCIIEILKLDFGIMLPNCNSCDYFLPLRWLETVSCNFQGLQFDESL